MTQYVSLDDMRDYFGHRRQNGVAVAEADIFLATIERYLVTAFPQEKGQIRRADLFSINVTEVARANHPEARNRQQLGKAADTFLRALSYREDAARYAAHARRVRFSATDDGIESILPTRRMAIPEPAAAPSAATQQRPRFVPKGEKLTAGELIEFLDVAEPDLTTTPIGYTRMRNSAERYATDAYGPNWRDAVPGETPVTGVYKASNKTAFNKAMGFYAARDGQLSRGASVADGGIGR